MKRLITAAFVVGIVMMIATTAYILASAFDASNCQAQNAQYVIPSSCSGPSGTLIGLGFGIGGALAFVCAFAGSALSSDEGEGER